MMKIAIDRIKHNNNRVRTKVLLLAQLFVFLLVVAPVLTPSQVNAASTSVHVTARVLPWLNVSATPLITSYRVDAKAIQNGFIDLPNSLSIQLATNVRSGIDLNLSSFGPERVVVSNGANSGTDMIRIANLSSNLPTTSAFDLRIILPQGIEQGDYPLQLNISAVNI